MQKIEKGSDEDLLDIIGEVADINMTELEQDVSAVLFFKEIYNKSDFYFKIFRSTLSSALSKVLLQIDSEITVLREHQQKYQELQSKFEKSMGENKALSQKIDDLQMKSEAYNAQMN